MVKWFRIGKHRFNNMEEFKAVQNLAIANSSNTYEEFEKFLDSYYSNN